MLALKRLQRKRSRIGLDIGASGVRAIQLTRAADKHVVTSAAICDPPRAAGGGPSDPSAGDGLARQISNCMRGSGFRGKALAAALSPPDVEFHTLELPTAALNAEPAEAAQIARFEIERLMSQQQGPVETRHWRLPETRVPAPNAIGAGAAHETINRTLDACVQAGWTCSDLDTSATALCRFGSVLQSRPKDQVWAVLDVGERQARLALCLDDTPVLVRTTGTGGRAWTQRIADALQVSFKAADIHKRDHGIALTGQRARNSSDDGARGELASLILGAVRADLNDLAAEVKRSYEYVLSCYPGKEAGDLVLCGGGSRLRNFPEFLAAALGIPVRRASEYIDGPSCRLRFAAEGNTPLESLAVAVGLAIAQ